VPQDLAAVAAGHLRGPGLVVAGPPGAGRSTAPRDLATAGEPTRRIAGQRGISAETVDTPIRAGMRELGVRTRTEAAALAVAHGDAPLTGPDSPTSADPDREDRR
jgi:hypothetical protein